mgnify:FL=1
MMKRQAGNWIVLILLICLFTGLPKTVFALSGAGPHIFDEAGLLTEAEKEELEELAARLGKERETDFLIITADGMDGKDIDRFTGEFIDRRYKEKVPIVVLALDMETRDVSVLAFNEARRDFGETKREHVLEEVIPYLSAGDFYGAFFTYLQLSHELMGIPPEKWTVPEQGTAPETAVQKEPPESIFTQWWFHVIVSLVVAGVTVSLMAYNSGGRVTVNSATYLNANTSRVLNRSDQYLRKTVTKRRKPQNKSGGPSGFGGGGGMTSGGHTFSSTRGKF